MAIRRTKEQKIKKFSSKMQASLLLVFCVIILAFIALIGRLFYLNKKDGERYGKNVLSQQTYSHKVIPYQRGTILDRNGTVLAKSVKVYNLILDPKVMLTKKKDETGKETTPYLEPTIQALVESFGFEEADLRAVIEEKSSSSYVVYKKQLKYDEVQKYKENVNKIDEKLAKTNKGKESYVKGVWFEDDYLRTYPLKTLASKVIGFTFSGNVGNNGIEGYYNDELNGTNGSQFGYFSSDNSVEDTVNPPTNGHNVISTLDVNIQTIVEAQIATFSKKIPNKNTSVVVMNPNNGEILAMAESKSYDLNNPRDLSAYYSKKEIKKMSEKEYQDALNDLWRNTIISNNFEPGSVIKPLVVAAALDEAKVSANSSFVCDGKEVVGGHTIKCSRRSGHGKITLEEVLSYSCNDGIMNIVSKLKRKAFSYYQDNFGLSGRTGIDLPGEAYGLVYDEEGLNDSELATSSFGQSMSVSMIQVLAAFSSSINGGYYYTPHVVKQITTENGAVVKNIQEDYKRQVISEETSKLIRTYLRATVESGTGQKAKVKGYDIGGKTGTAQKIPRSEDKYVVSFAGFAPVDNPQVVVYVTIDEPEGEEYYDSSSIACELSADIMKQIFPFLGIYSTEGTNDIPVNPYDPSKDDYGVLTDSGLDTTVADTVKKGNNDETDQALSDNKTTDTTNKESQEKKPDEDGASGDESPENGTDDHTEDNTN